MATTPEVTHQYKQLEIYRPSRARDCVIIGSFGTKDWEGQVDPDVGYSLTHAQLVEFISRLQRAADGMAFDEKERITALAALTAVQKEVLGLK